MKLRILSTILTEGWVGVGDDAALQAMGAVFGDALVQDPEVPFEWVQVNDEQGIDPALRMPGSTILVFPLTTLAKQLAENPQFDLYEFYVTVQERIKELRI